MATDNDGTPQALIKDLIAEMDRQRGRAEQAEERAERAEGDSADWKTDGETWEENHRILAENLSRVIEQQREEIRDLSRRLDVLTLTLVNTEARAESWWEAAKSWCRTANDGEAREDCAYWISVARAWEQRSRFNAAERDKERTRADGYAVDSRNLSKIRTILGES